MGSRARHRILSVVLLISAGAAAWAADFIPGDVNDDGVFDIADPTVLRRELAGLDPGISQMCMAELPATGQKGCWAVVFGPFPSSNPIPCAGTGQDGNVQAGAPLAYRDNGDGTITDLNTGLMWAKQSDDFGIHDKDRLYPWDDAFSSHVAFLNNSDHPFAGYTDWRVPNVKELYSLLDFGQNTERLIDPIFDSGCTPGCTVTTCSCMSIDIFWSSTSHLFNPAFALAVFFRRGQVSIAEKDIPLHVRAVRDDRVRAMGQPCHVDARCDPGLLCVDGVCCDSACSGPCESCLSASTGNLDGTCAFVTAGTDPDGECSPPEVCGGTFPGVCGCPKITNCKAVECGPLDDGCGGVLDCGACGRRQTCVEGVCLFL